MKLVNALGLVLALAAASAGCGGDGAARARNHHGVEDAIVLAPRDVAQATPADLATGIPVSGTLQPLVDVHIASPVPEVLEAVLVREGQAVTRGQVLARFRTTALAPAAAGAEARARVASADYQRMKNLLEAGAISERELEGAEATSSEADAQLASANKRLAEATVRAPVSGTIAKRWVQAGDRVSDGDPLFRLVDNAELELEATVPAEFMGRFRPGTVALLTVSGDSITRAGTVVRINPSADPATRQIRLYVRVMNRDRRLVGDQFATGRLVLARASRALAVPRAAVRTDPDGSAWAWVIVAGRVEKRALATGLADESADLVQITSGLTAGDSVIVAPAEGLVAGKSVSISGRES
jgi:RND family efflux transporter MFP subunit